MCSLAVGRRLEKRKYQLLDNLCDEILSPLSFACLSGNGLNKSTTTQTWESFGALQNQEDFASDCRETGIKSFPIIFQFLMHFIV